MTNIAGSDYVAISQIVLPIITLIGIIISMWLSVKALREVQIDRKIKYLPHLAFEPGGWKLPIEFRKVGPAVAGIEPKYAREAFKNIPSDAKSISLKTKKLADENEQIISMYGKLRNYGSGPALSTHVTWIARKIKVGIEDFEITKDKLREPRYSRELNCIPASPSNIMPSETANFFRLPTFIQKDHEKKIAEVDGILEIACTDIFGRKQVTNQKFHVLTNYGSDNSSIYMTFGDVINTFLL